MCCSLRGHCNSRTMTGRQQSIISVCQLLGVSPALAVRGPLIRLSSICTCFISLDRRDLMNIPPFMSILTDPSEVMELEVTVCWTGAGWLRITAVSHHADMESGLSQKQPFISACLRSEGQLQDSLFCTFPNHTPLGFITSSVWASARPPGILLHFSLACRPFSVSAEGLDGLGAVWPGAFVRWAKLQNGTQEEIRNMRWPLSVCCYVQFLALRRLQANTQACMKARKGIKEWVLCFGEVLITGTQEGGTGLLPHSSLGVEVQHSFQWKNFIDYMITVTQRLLLAVWWKPIVREKE